MINYRKAETDADIRAIADLASVIWHEHFTPIIGIEQVEYMLKKFQSYEAISDAVKNGGYTYYMAEVGSAEGIGSTEGIGSAEGNGSKLAGYLGAHPDADNVFLSKIYVERSHRRRGIASAMLDMVKSDFADKDYMWLTVNRNNDIAVSTYNALGFDLWREQVSDIGNGFVMDDYVFRYDLK